jgi:phosphotransferase system enzyme I (PtsP)
VEVGSMVEVPSLLYQLDELLERVDFLSVGSNDLVQFLYAIDRGNARVANRFDALSAPVLRALKDIAEKANEHKKPVTLCGELASQPLGALALVAIGYRALSLTPSAIGPVKAMLLDLDCGKIADFLNPLIDKPARAAPIRAQLQKFAADSGLQL